LFFASFRDFDSLSLGDEDLFFVVDHELGIDRLALELFDSVVHLSALAYVTEFPGDQEFAS
jgi:hypothetical protein